MKRSTLFQKQFLKYLIEFTVIILGVLIAFWLESWRLQNKEFKETLTLVHAALDNINDDIANFKKEKNQTEYRISKLILGLDLLQTDSRTENDKVILDSAGIVRNRLRVLHTSIFYEQLISNADFRNISPKLYFSLMKYIDEVENLKWFSDHAIGRLTQAENNIWPLFNFNHKSGRLEYNLTQLTEEQRIYDVLALSWEFHTVYDSFLENILTQAKGIKEEIESTLKRED